MVSLINFKIVSDELQQERVRREGQQRALGLVAAPPARDQVRIRMAQPDAERARPAERQESSAEPSDASAKFRFVQTVAAAARTPAQAQQEAASAQKPAEQANPSHPPPQQPLKPQMLFGALVPNFGPADAPSGEDAPFAGSAGTADFVVTWRGLSFAIEPKWHQRLGELGSVGALAGRLADSRRRSSPPAPREQQAAAADTRVVLDRLDGSFKSGELTAILGPSGAGKTTLLDCLTGHRKHGLSGSIKISSPASSDAGGPVDLSSPFAAYSESSLSGGAGLGCPVDAAAPAGAAASARSNLKVSIIPQNDHLIGHLTVYETLTYASKMKNCFERQFNHKLNIKRVAQQLGLMSCLSTRINKLSGGQYKRVSIAQELLSSPDILILDEPTSGLDAMTCYQTVRVLRKLTDERQASGQKQIAVILTIHQPNSDVFQQFNHVYVVAQGGKCIYEGPPASIESVINRVGIRLPNTHYNTATMVVEIAAGKFGQEAIHKLNDIQKKQYDFALLDEQNSTGDSAVDCPSSSNEDEDAYAEGRAKVGDKRRRSLDVSEASARNEPKRMRRSTTDSGGLVNKGFVLDGDTQTQDANNNDESTAGGAPVVVRIRARDEDADSVDKIKMMNHSNNATALDSATGEPNGTGDGRRKKRRKVRKRASESNGNSLVIVPMPTGASPDKLAINSSSEDSGGGGGGGGSGGGGGGGDRSKREKRVKLNSLKADQKFPFWRHTYLHFHRSWLSIVRDPMLCSMQLALHIIVPLMVSLVYGTNVGKPNACPRAGPVDIMAYALEPTDSALQLQEDLRTTLENIGYIFFKLYGIIFAAMTVTVLTFPLDMHVLVKEFRNGWYGLSSYFLGRTLADIPFQLTLPLLAMSLSYYATGQPYSYMQWRFLSITGILILSSLIAQSQGLLFGAILMDKMKAAVFVAPAATTPIILFAGFLVRTQSIPSYLRPLSNLSYLRYAIEACLISRYGFNQCECDPAVFNQTVPELPPIAKSMLDYWLTSFKAPISDSSLTGNSTSAIETTTLAATESPDLFTKLIDSLARANSFGRNITSCEQVVPYPMIDYDLKDSQLFSCFAILIFMLVFTRLLTFFIVCFKVKRKV